MPVELASKQGVNALRNLQTLPKTLNNDFKKPFDRYVAKLLKQDSIDQKDIDNVRAIVKQAEELGIDEVEYAKRKQQIDDILENMYWYDRKVFEICASGKSVAELSRETTISYYSLYNTYINAKKHIKEQL